MGLKRHRQRTCFITESKLVEKPLKSVLSVPKKDKHAVVKQVECNQVEVSIQSLRFRFRWVYLSYTNHNGIYT